MEPTTKGKRRTVLVEMDRTAGAYGLGCIESIVDSLAHGRLYLRQGYGGESRPEGGAYRWRHGMACRVDADATLDSLRAELAEAWTLVGIHELPGVRVQPWDGLAVQAIAKSAGLPL